jgi:hypothetical protein
MKSVTGAETCVLAAVTERHATVGGMDMSQFAAVKIWECINQITRTMRYEIPLASALQAHRAGTITGVGAVMTRELEIEHVEFQLLADNLEKAIEVSKLTLEQAGAPTCSEISYPGNGKDEVLCFGQMEGMAIYLDGVNLPDKVYDTCSSQGLADLIYGPLTTVGGEIRGSWVGPSETAIYLYGPNAEHIFSVIEPIVATYPLCQNARLVVRNGNPKCKPRSVRLPFHSNPESVRQVIFGKAHGTG